MSGRRGKAADLKLRATNAQQGPDPPQVGNPWRKLHRGLGKVPGTLIIDGAGVEFRPNKGSSIRWSFVEIQSLDPQPRRSTVTGYEKRGRLRPGTKQFRFDLRTDLPAPVGSGTGEKRRQTSAKPLSRGLPASPPSPRHRTGFGRDQKQRDSALSRRGDRLRDQE